MTSYPPHRLTRCLHTSLHPNLQPYSQLYLQPSLQPLLQQRQQNPGQIGGRSKISTAFRPANLFVSCVVLALSVGTLAQEVSLDQIKQMELAALKQGVATQESINSLDDERTALANDYRNTLKHLSKVNTYNQQLRDTIQQQDEEAQLLQDQIERIGSLEQNIVPLMVDMLDALENFIALDVPFLLEDRQNRVKVLRRLLSDNNLANSEKYRRILEAYQIENDYGRTIEAYDRKLNGNDQEKMVTYLKIGRLAYFYQTFDGEQTYRWSSISQAWELLNDSDNQSVQTAIAMAKERLPSDLLLVPIEIPHDSARVSAGEMF